MNSLQLVIKIIHFSGFIPQLGRSRLEQGRKRQGFVPDFRILVPAAGGGEGAQVEELVLAELKVISCCPTRYQRDLAPLSRLLTDLLQRCPMSIANMLEKSIENMEVFQTVFWTCRGQVHILPPALQRWVFGAWGEASEDGHILVKDLATKSQAPAAV